MRVLCRRFVVQYWPWFVLIACQSEALGITCAFLVLVRCNWLLFALVVYVCVAMHAAVVSYIGILSFALCVFSTGQLWVFFSGLSAAFMVCSDAVSVTCVLLSCIRATRCCCPAFSVGLAFVPAFMTLIACALLFYVSFFFCLFFFFTFYRGFVLAFSFMG